MKYKKPLKITHRTSTVANSFVQAVIPWIEPTAEERTEALRVLGMSEGEISCVYCGGHASDWDHLRPLVKGKRPTGYISDHKNLVPACGPCNQSKGASEWRTWINGNAKGAPKRRGIIDISKHVETLERFEAWGNVEPVDLNRLVSPQLWSEHWSNLDRLQEDLRRAQEHAHQLQSVVQQEYAKLNR
jgi:hypothetical protein